MDSILLSVKKMLGIIPEYEYFDSDLIFHINSTFTILTQLGVGPEQGYRIEDASNKWDEFIPSGQLLEMVKSYMFLRVKLLFDPPTSSAAMDAINRQISEFEWRINVCVDPGVESGG